MVCGPVKSSTFLPFGTGFMPAPPFARVATSAAHGLADADNGNGYDHNWVLGAPAADGLRPVARVYEPTSGRTMVVRTDQPGVQFYTGNYLDGDVGRPDVLDGYGKHSGFCLETQHFPDSVNQPSFPPVWLRPGETYSHVTEHTFGAAESAPGSCLLQPLSWVGTG